MGTLDKDDYHDSQNLILTMRYIVQDGEQYVALHPPGARGIDLDFYYRTHDVVDAHDFQIPSAAEAWRLKHAAWATVHEINDDGSWPLEEPA